MRINYCDGYYREGNDFFRHDDVSGMDFIVSEDEAMAHKPEVLLDEFYDMPSANQCDDEEVLVECKKYNSYQDAISQLEVVVKNLENDGNLDGVGAVYDVILWMKEQQTESLKKIGIIF